MLDKAKDPIDPMLKNGVYSLPCSCDEEYIGETGRSIKTRLKEHCVDIKHERIKNSVVAEHSKKTNHYICMEKAKVLALEEHYNKRRIREALEIEKQPKNFNRDDGLILSESWKPILNLLKKQQLTDISLKNKNLNLKFNNNQY